jgi:hypothetical protein
MQTVPFIPEGTPAHITAIVESAIQFNQNLCFGVHEPLEDLYVGYLSNSELIPDPDERYQVYKTKTEVQQFYDSISKTIAAYEAQHNTLVTFYPPNNDQ